MHALLIDGFNLVRRVYEANPRKDVHTLDREILENAVQSLVRALHQHKPSHCCCIFDSHESTWRHQLYPAYKANRKPTPPALLNGLPAFEEAFLQSGVTSLCVPHYEADDVIATLATGISKNGGKVTILSTDKNFLQLLDENIHLYNHFQEEEFTKSRVLQKYAVKQEQLLDYWSLTGDATNNIAGVPGIGPKTAGSLLGQYESLDVLLKDPPDNAIGEKIRRHRQDAEDARELLSLDTDVQVGINLRQLRYREH